MTRRVLVSLIVALVMVLIAGVSVYVFVLAVPDYRTAVLVDSSAPGTGLPEVADAVKAVAGNSGESDALSLRRFGGECGSPDNTEEIADSPDEVAQAVGTLAPSGKATLVDGVMAAIEDFDGVLTRRGSVRNRIIVVSMSGSDACAGDPARARKAIDDRLAEEGLDLDIRVVGFRIPEDQRDALADVVGAASTVFADNAADLDIVLEELVVPDSPEAAPISVPAPEPAATYAFTTASRMAIVRETEVIAEVAGEFALSAARYSADGNFVFAVTSEGVVSLDARSGADRVVPCGGCSAAVPTGESVIGWLAGNVVTTLDLADADARPEPGATVLPGRQVDELSSILPLRILASQDGNTLIAAPDGVSAYGGGAENLYLVGPGGTVRPIGLAAGNVAISDVTFSPDGQSAAYVAGGHAGACETISSPVLIDLATGVHTELPFPGDPAVEGTGIRDLWYDEDGALTMIFTSWRCESSGGAITSQVVPESRWRREGSAWTRQGPGSAGHVRDVGPGYRAVLVMPDLETFAGELFSEIDGVRTRIAGEVLSIAVPE